MKRSWQIISLTTVVLLTVLLLGARLHYSSRNEVIARFQEQQLLHAHHVAERIEHFFEGYAQISETFSALISYQHESMSELRRDLHAYSLEMERNFMKKISLYDAHGRIVYSTDQDTVGLHDGKNEIFVWCRNPENKDKIFVVPLHQAVQNPESGSRSAVSNLQQLQFILAVPLYEAAGKLNPGQKENFLGALSFTVDLLPFLLEELEDSAMMLHDAWIIDERGLLLFHSRHPRMKFGNVYQEDKNCRECHDSFDYAKEILRKKEGVLVFKTKKPKKKLAGFSPMHFEGVSWVVVVDSEDIRVTSYLSKNLREHLLLFGIAAIALSWSAVLMYRNYQASVRAREEVAIIQERDAERRRMMETLAESEQRLRDLSARLLTAQEQERNRISRELHDEVGPALATLKLRLGLIERKALKDQGEIRKECAETLEYLDLMIENIRRFSRDLSPSALEHFGLSVALHRLLADFAKDYNIQVNIDVIDDIDRFFSRADQTIIYRIVQEITHNVGKHANATRFSATAALRNGSISFLFEDNGKGFDMNALTVKDFDRKGLGLDIMKERAGMLGGMLEVSSHEGKGTRITLRIPVAERGNA